MLKANYSWQKKESEKMKIGQLLLYNQRSRKKKG